MKKELRDLISNYLEEKISLSEFIEIIMINNKYYLKLIKRKGFKVLLEKALEYKTIYSFQFEIEFYSYIKKNLSKKKYFSELEKTYVFLIDSLPDWFDGYNIDYLYKLFKSINLPLSDPNIKDLYQKEITRNFRFEKYPPIFLTSFDWPMKDDKPLFFKKMKEVNNDNLIIHTYVFFDENEKKEVIITQYDYQ